MIRGATVWKTEILANSPNPFNPSTRIRYTVGRDGPVTLKVFDAVGRELRTLVSEEQKRGAYDYSFEASAFANGIYILSLTAGGEKSFRRMMLLK